MKAFHNSRDTLCRAPFGARPTGSRVTLRVMTDASTVTLRIWDGVQILYAMDFAGYRDGMRVFEADIDVGEEPRLLWYYFVLEENGETLYLGAPDDQLGGEGAIYAWEPPSFQITVYDAAYKTPEWLSQGVMYHIFVDRFCDGAGGKLLKKRKDITVHTDWYEPPCYTPEGRTGDNLAKDFFGGNLKGVQEKLPYLADLGVTVIYMCPIFKAPSNHKYDTTDYNVIDPTFGSERDFRSLCRKAKALGIRVMLDGVFSHNGEDSVYFNKYGHHDTVGACQSKDSPYYSWYRFKEYPERYVCWWGIPTLPELNEDDPSYRAFIMGENGVAAHWLKAGASGWRLDVADELPDDFIEQLRVRVKTVAKDAALLGEVWEDATNKISYDTPRTYALGRGLDSVMNYPLRDALNAFFTFGIDAGQVVRRLDSQRENYPPALYASLMNLMGSHDRARALNVLVQRTWEDEPREALRGRTLTDEERALAVKRLKLFARVVFYLPGMPCVFYGDEAGMEGAGDPFNRACYPWGREDAALVGFFKDVIAHRKADPIFTQGELHLSAPHPDVLVVKRMLNDGMRMLFVNRSDAPVRVAIPARGLAHLESLDVGALEAVEVRYDR